MDVVCCDFIVKLMTIRHLYIHAMNLNEREILIGWWKKTGAVIPNQINSNSNTLKKWIWRRLFPGKDRY